MRNTTSKILLVEDDEALGYLMSEYLKMKHFNIDWAKNGIEALKLISSFKYHLAILDVMMPQMDGFTLAQKIKDQYSDLPFIFLTARSMKIDVLKGFSLGAVDYLKKPIDEEELVVRIESLLSRLPSTAKGSDEVIEEILTIGNYTFNTKLQQLQLAEKQIKLTSKEAELILFFYNRKNQLCSHKDILTSVWDKNDYFNRKSLNVFITRLRKYFSLDSDIQIENVHNQGFIFSVDE
ncbi:response regulator transcription factor [Zhouia sp. PK063]|uniref:response regulator transcription factor n=1 Tax=Zhouia sp. PK063 TaxID=3373602 RepID=UPI0037A9B68F